METCKSGACQSALRRLENKNAQLARTVADLQTKLYIANQRSDQFAARLGFSDISQAEGAAADAPRLFSISTLESLHDRIHELEASENALRELVAAQTRAQTENLETVKNQKEELDWLKKENGQLETELVELKRKYAEKEGGTAQITIERTELPTAGMSKENRSDAVQPTSPNSALSSPLSSRLTRDLLHLQQRYDALLEIKERAATRYRKDYQKWHQFKQWLFQEGQEYKRSETVTSKEQRRRQEAERLVAKRRRFADIVGGPGPDILNSVSPLHTPQQADLPALATAAAHPNVGPSLAIRPTMETKKADDSREEPSKGLMAAPSNPDEQDEQDFWLQRNRISTETRSGLAFHVAANVTLETPRKQKRSRTDLGASSETEDDTQAVSPVRSRILHRQVREATSQAKYSTHSHNKSPQRARVCDLRSPRGAPEARPASPKARTSTPCFDPGQSRAQGFDIVQAEPTPLSRNLSANMDSEATGPPKRPSAHTAGDYSAFKGRGRYRVAQAKTINAQFEINPGANEGLRHQYNDVVRDREARKHLPASDCECCRDYYATVGTVPTSRNRPLWKTPRHKRHHGQETDIDPSHSHHEGDHRQDISRHRHKWAPPATPPGYWDIGFPDTQAAADINRKATEMESKKVLQIKSEAVQEGGRYRERP